MRKIFVVPIEPLDNRYTKQWYTWIPDQLRKMYPQDVIDTIEGVAYGYDAPTAGAFFDFAGTCKYKASQVERIANLFSLGAICDGDIFFFTDAWNPAIHFVKYMAELKQIKVKLAGIWHAGWYDPTDILGTTIKSRDWAFNIEQSLYCALDMNFFGTEHHRDIFTKVHGDRDGLLRSAVCGYPLEYIAELWNNVPKERIVVFPHRISPDKDPEMFDVIREYTQQWDPTIRFVKTQDFNLSKVEYYEFLKKSSIVFSCSKHENLGIGTFEAMSAGCFPLVPNRLSYTEMYPSRYKYPENTDAATLAHAIMRIMNTPIDTVKLATDTKEIQEKYFSGTKMFQLLGTL